MIGNYIIIITYLTEYRLYVSETAFFIYIQKLSVKIENENKNSLWKLKMKISQRDNLSDKENMEDDILDLRYSSSDSSSESDSEEEYCTKIFYCSRTHSQLSQV